MYTKFQWLTFWYVILVCFLNVALIVVLYLIRPEDLNWKNYDPDTFRIAGLILNSISLVMKFIHQIIDCIKSWTKICRGKCNHCEDVTTICEGCLHGIIFILAYIGSIVLLVYNAILRTEVESPKLTVSCVLFAILCLMHTVWVVLFYIWDFEEGDESESDPLLS